jgi:hypothetical protein
LSQPLTILPAGKTGRNATISWAPRLESQSQRTMGSIPESSQTP